MLNVVVKACTKFQDLILKKKKKSILKKKQTTYVETYVRK